jgi:hypothetical protein
VEGVITAEIDVLCKMFPELTEEYHGNVSVRSVDVQERILAGFVPNVNNNNNNNNNKS